MKTWVYLIVGILVLMALGAVLRFAIGVLFWVGLAVIIGAIAVSVVRGWTESRQLNAAPGARAERKLDREADRALEELERRSGNG